MKVERLFLPAGASHRPEAMPQLRAGNHAGGPEGADVRGQRRITCSALSATRSTYKPINSRTYFTGGLP